MDPIVIDPAGFDQAAAWKECLDYVDKCGGMETPNGDVNWRAAFAADPGCCSCPACGEMYWMWGRVQRCTKCSFEYPTDWWEKYSWGTQAHAGRRHRGTWPYKHDEYMKHPYYRFGFEHPVDDPWRNTKTPEFRLEIRKAMTTGGADEPTR